MEQSILAGLKQTNISANPEKTKERTEQLWKSIGTAKQKEVLQFLQLRVSSIYRAYKTGNISAKIVVALAQACDANPYYLTGEGDEFDGYSEELLKQFLIDHGYAKLVEATAVPKKKRRSAKSKIEALPEETPVTEDFQVPECYEQVDVVASILDLFQTQYDAIPVSQKEFIQELAGEDMDALLKALFIKSKTVDKSANIERLIKLLLIS